MEDGPNGLSSAAVLPQTVRNGEVMANFPDVGVSVGNESKTETSPLKVNGDSNLDQSKSEEESDSSDFNALIIDESIKPEKTKKKSRKPKCGGFKGFKKSDDSNTFLHSNPYFSESIFDLLEKSQGKKEDINENECAVNDKKINCRNHVKHHTDKKTKSNPKLREYAQYLGLQPTVQFKCSKCSRSGFLSLATLNEHLLNCNESAPVNDSSCATSIPSTPTTNIRVTRKVFLCSACGTYYENWNLFLHMREVHKRYICLYCLGMFSHPEKLSFHIITKHNCIPKHINSLEEFYNIHKEPCFLICCLCQRGFTDRDNFFDHKCDESKLNTNKSLGQKHLSKQGSKIQKQKSVEHVTADSNSTDLILENNMATDINLTNALINDKVATESVDVVCDNLKNVESMAINMKTGTVEVTQTQESMKLGNSQLNSENILIAESVDQLSKNDENNSITVETQQNSIICDNLMSNCDTKTSEMECRNLNIYDEHISEELDEPDKGDDNILDESDCFDHDTNISEQENCQDDLNDSFDISLPDEDVDLSHPNKLDDEELLEINKENPEFEEVEEDTRKVPKVTLKLPKTFEYTDDDAAIYESDESEKLTMEVDQIENEAEANISNESENANQTFNSDSQLQVAGSDVPIIELELEQPLDKFDIRVLLQKCLSATVSSCVYCNHARKISVNGKQLGLHAVAEHRFSAVVNSITAEELIPESFVTRITDGLSELENIFFNLDSSSTEEAITFSHVFECFQCRYSTTIHKELYLHNRKMHAKSILLCIMCKSNFYSYSELICHLCPGLYELENDVHFKCCMCVSDELPSAFRLMVHLRKRHHACDVCLELCNNQSKLSNHVWKHKLHHLCYRCGIAYRNKPDITKHLFWKHGTESVLCKKCLQKKWPHVYHFCIPPPTFLCEECNLSFSRAVSLVVHKRLHKDDKPHLCAEENCGERFISKKLLLKHEFKHREPPEEAVKLDVEKSKEDEPCEFSSTVDENIVTENTNRDTVEIEEKPKPKVDVYDLPELNLSESDSSDSDEDGQSNVKDVNSIANDSDKNDHLSNETESPQSSRNLLKIEKPTPVLETIWDDFRNYQANKEKLDGCLNEPERSAEVAETIPSLEVIMKDHDYCEILYPDDGDETNKRESIDMSVDHDYCFGQNSRIEPKETPDTSKIKSSKKKLGGTSSSNSSSNSDSSSCTCGSNCSCSSSSASSSSSSDSSESDSSSSEGRRRQQARRARRKQKGKNKKKESESAPVDVVATDNQTVIALDVPIQESDLETTETDTDEDFYDKQPHKLAKKLLAEKKNQLLQMAAIGPYINGSLMDGSRPSTPSLLEEPKLKKKSKSKKRKKKNKSSKYESENPNANIPDNYSTVTPLTISLPKHSPVHTSHYNSPNSNIVLPSMSQHMGLNENDSNLRASKRRRVPNKFYGYSSDEEQDKIPQPPVYKWRKVDLPTPRSPMVVPPITIKTVQPTPSVEPISVRASATEDVRLQPNRPFQYFRPPLTKVNRSLPAPEQDSASDSNDSSSEEERPPIKEQPALYCYCRCPYDEVSEMIGCDASDCAIEWFHFECVGIMVPPKGQWFCPDCRKKKQQRREMLQTQL